MPRFRTSDLVVAMLIALVILFFLFCPACRCCAQESDPSAPQIVELSPDAKVDEEIQQPPIEDPEPVIAATSMQELQVSGRPGDRLIARIAERLNLHCNQFAEYQRTQQRSLLALGRKFEERFAGLDRRFTPITKKLRETTEAIAQFRRQRASEAREIASFRKERKGFLESMREHRQEMKRLRTEHTEAKAELASANADLRAATADLAKWRFFSIATACATGLVFVFCLKLQFF